MSESTDDRPAIETSRDQTSGDETDLNARPSRRGIRFGLLELLLLTAVIAAWLPVIMARRRIPVLESEIETMRLATLELIITDEQQLNARTLPSIWHNISSWKYSAPAGADLELRLATEGINSIAFPADYQAVALPQGEHTIHLKVLSDTEAHHTEVYVDDEVVLQQHHRRDWLASTGSSSSGGVSEQSTAYPLDQPLKLKLQRYSIKHPLEKYESVEIPGEYDNKGNYLWISPRSSAPDPPSNFFAPRTKYSHDAIGHRQGMKVCRSSRKGLVGLICIQPSLDSTLGDRRRGYYHPLGISVRPVLDNESNPEIPEQQADPAQPTSLGIPVSLRDTIAPPDKYDDTAVNELVTTKGISADGKNMRLFAHYRPFASGAKPIVEVLFDSAHPERVGFLPHAAPDSSPMIACQFVTQFDARFLWRDIELLPDSDDDPVSASLTPSRVPLSQLYPQIDFAKITESKAGGNAPLSWRSIPLERLPHLKPADAAAGMFKMSLITDVADSSKLKFAKGLPPTWQYKGVANRQVWWLPAGLANDRSQRGIKVEVRAAPVFPNTTIPLPGGPAVSNVRITVPMPATQPVWLEIVAEPSPKK